MGPAPLTFRQHYCGVHFVNCVQNSLITILGFWDQPYFTANVRFCRTHVWSIFEVIAYQYKNSQQAAVFKPWSWLVTIYKRPQVTWSPAHWLRLQTHLAMSRCAAKKWSSNQKLISRERARPVKDVSPILFTSTAVFISIKQSWIKNNFMSVVIAKVCL